jgi:hypothetical protein
VDLRLVRRRRFSECTLSDYKVLSNHIRRTNAWTDSPMSDQVVSGEEVVFDGALSLTL